MAKIETNMPAMHTFPHNSLNMTKVHYNEQ